ncbi:hypothetical protein [Sphingomonas sp.]|uniref:hypothetical protein n=1 Tax=Sphingomonas sp. TaxID=28214 RepID=UPI00286CAC5D|nr:hypothetical protein [Sphingomonas sp.]
MRYFLDTEFDGVGGRLISLALVPEDGGEELYVVIAGEATEAWVQRHVMPYLDTVPEPLRSPHLSRRDAAETVSQWLANDHAIEIVADWPEDLAQFSMLLVIAPGDMVAMNPLTLRLVRIGGFSCAANSEVPHNALHDARALRKHIMTHLE